MNKSQAQRPDNDTSNEASPPLCLGSVPCRSHPGGGACERCGYPIAYAHPSSLLEAFEVEAVWVNGSAILVQPQPHLQPGIVSVLQRDGSSKEYTIPKDTLEENPSVEKDAPRVSKEQPPATALGVSMRRHLLEVAASLLGSGKESAEALSAALIEGIASLPHGWMLSPHHETLTRFTKEPTYFCGTQLQGAKLFLTVQGVQTLLTEVGNTEYGIVGTGMSVDDNRPSLDVGWTTVGPFTAPLSRLRLALLPGEADHVELYDVCVGEKHRAPIGISMISRLPGYSPEVIREIPGHVNINGRLVRKYLPGTVLAGQLRDGADATRPNKLSPEDLLGGVEIDLGCTFPPMSSVYLFYRVAPGHIFCAAVEPIK